MWGFPWFFKSNKPKPMNNGLIIDVSHHNGLIQWEEVAKDPQNIRGAFIKATEGQTYTDAELKYNSTEAKRAGLKVGYYHFSTLNTSDVVLDASNEAKFFVSVISKCPSPDLPLVLDIETNKAGLSPQLISVWVLTFFTELKNLGYNDYILYSYTPFLNANLPKDHQFSNIKLWIAAYTPTLRLPIGWAKEWLWQFTAKGKVKGIKTDCDLNKFPN